MRINMKLCVMAACLLLLSGCAEPEPPLAAGAEGHGPYGIYELTFSVEALSGNSPEEWEFTYLLDGQPVTTGHRFLYSLELFTFRYIQVEISGQASVRFPVAICDGGSGKSEVTVTDNMGRTAAYRIVCRVTKIGEQP